MRRKVRNVGIVLETRDDALAVGRPLSHLYHWREPEEIEAVTGALAGLGFVPRLLGTPAQVAQRLDAVRGEVDFVFNISVGFVTRYRMALGPSLYALAGLPYSGADPYGKLVSQNKQLTYGLLGALGLPVPGWRYCDRVEDAQRLEARAYPAIVKPAWEGASIGLEADAVVRDAGSLRALARRLIETLGMPVIVQDFIRGRELKVGILGDAPTLFEGILEDTGADGSAMGDRFLYFDAKKQGAFGKRRVDSGEPGMAALLADCRRIYRLLAPLDYATFDVRVDEAGRHYFLEVNADATLHPRRTLAECCRLNGLDYRGLIDAIMRSAFARQDLDQA